MAVQDLVLTEDNELLVENGDLVIGDSQRQHIRLVAASAPGFWRMTPFLGPDLATFLLDEPNASEIQQRIQTHLELDGCKGVSFDMSSGISKLKIKGRYD